MDIQTAKQIFDAHDGIMKAKEIQENKIHSHYLANLVKQGYVERIRHGYYQWQDERAFSEAATIARLFPDAVICRESALQYYGYTDRTPAAWCLAVDRGYTRSRFKIDYPMVKPAFFSQEQMKLGVEIVEIEDVKLQIFNREHIICDCLRQENKMDAEIFNKAIQAYIKDSKKNVPRLMEYAKILRTENKVRKVIGVWL
jgi:predicted transcriptional regulator of viral defense system